MVAIIDYDAGNIKSVEKALLHLGEEVIITRDREQILNSDKVILPGVGAFGDAMEKLRSYGLDKVIYEVVERKIPFLGICLGLQLLFEKSDETPGVKGLGVLPGEEDVAATTEYSTLIHAAVEHDNVFACQFHPEKSSEIGLKILKNFVEL